jgi:phosphoribosylamine--glycine ligase
MRVLVIGSGGREHALVWRLRQCEQVECVYAVPGNPGMAIDGSCIPGAPSSAAEIVALAETVAADLTIVGPEAPLVAGLADEFLARKLLIIGPDSYGAQLEGSKIFAKQFMAEHGIPTADFTVVETAAELERTVAKFGFPVALKADGLAAGKGVVLGKTQAEALETGRAMLAGSLVGDAGRRIVIERCLQGEEVSFIVLSDGERYFTFAPTQDHKAVFDNDEGPNTGGMGAYCADGILPDSLRSTVLQTIVEPTLAALRESGHPFRGFLYFGLMLTSEGPQVLEFNVRLGDPETQPLMVRLSGDFAGLLESAARGQLDPSLVGWKPGSSACIVLTSEGYPGAYPKGRPIDGLREAEQGSVKVFHAGTLLQEGRIVTSGGRVLGVTAAGATLQEALSNAYTAVGQIHFEGMHVRRDIGQKGIKRQLT